MEVESVLIPPKLRLNANIRQYITRLTRLSPSHPVNSQLVNNHQILTNRPKKSILQLDRIESSILEFTQNVNLEDLQHHYFAPWEKAIPYSVKINKLDKESATLKHQELVNSTKSDQTYFNIYTDASKLPDSEGVGVGLAVINRQRTTYIEKVNIGGSQTVYDGKLEGVIRVVEYISSIA